MPLAADHFRYFAGCIRAEEGTLAELDNDTVAYHFKEPMGVVAQIIPWNFPLLMAAWKMAPALATGNCVVIKPASDTPLSLAILMDLIGDILPPGVLNVVIGHGSEVGAPLASSPRIAKVSFTGETTTGRQIMQYAAENLIPSTMELGGKSPNIFMADVMDPDDAFLDKALEGFALFAFNKGEVCTCPSRALVQESIFDKFMEKAVARVGKISMGHPLDPTTQMGAQASHGQLEKILGYIDVGKQEGARWRPAASGRISAASWRMATTSRPTVFVGHNKMRIFQEEIFGPVLSVTTFKTVEDAIAIGNDTIYGLGAGVWSRNGTRRLSRRPRDPGRARVDQLLPHVSGACGVRRLQAVGLRPRDAQDDHGPLPADQEPAGQLQPERNGLLLIGARGRGRIRSPAARLPGGNDAGTRLRHRAGGGIAPPTAAGPRRT